MKKTTLLLVLFYNFMAAQTEISFEPSEGFNLGEINGQQEWAASEAYSSLFTISDENATAGEFALKGSHIGDITIPQGNLAGTLSGTYDFGTGNKEITMDIYLEAPEEENSSEVHVITQSLAEELLTTRVAFYNQDIYVIYNNHGTLSFEQQGNYSYDTWHSLRIYFDFQNGNILYYLNNDLFYTGNIVAAISIDNFGFFFNNADGGFFVDNIIINESPTMGTEDFTTLDFSYLTKDNQLTISSRNSLEQVLIYDVQGRKVLSQNSLDTTVTIPLIALPQGVYIVNAHSNSQIKSFKIIKE